MAKTAPYLTAELKLVKETLSALLSRDVKTVSQLLRTRHREDIQPLAKIFIEAARSRHKWRGAILGHVPLTAWVIGPQGERQLDPSIGGSLRFLNLNSAAKTPRQHIDLLNLRKKIFDSLLSKIPRIQREKYRPMLQWVPAEESGIPDLVNMSLAADSAFGHNLFALEDIHSRISRINEATWVKKNKWPHSETMPNKYAREVSIKARDLIFNDIKKWLDEASVVEQNAEESIYALTIANLSSNRALLEFASLEALAAKAVPMCIKILDALNAVGVTEIPEEMHGAEGQERLDRLKRVLQQWFMHDGVHVHAHALFNRPMTCTTIEKIVEWATYLQERYFRTRGGLGGIEAAAWQHGSSSHLFIFALTLVGAFYCKTKVSYEMFGHSDPSYAVFPSASQATLKRQTKPKPHAERLLLHAYGLIYFSNSDWNLYSEAVTEYADTCSIKRSHIQQIFAFATKSRSSRELLTLNSHLQRLRKPADGAAS